MDEGKEEAVAAAAETPNKTPCTIVASPEPADVPKAEPEKVKTPEQRPETKEERHESKEEAQDGTGAEEGPGLAPVSGPETASCGTGLEEPKPLPSSQVRTPKARTGPSDAPPPAQVLAFLAEQRRKEEATEAYNRTGLTNGPPTMGGEDRGTDTQPAEAQATGEAAPPS